MELFGVCKKKTGECEFFTLVSVWSQAGSERVDIMMYLGVNRRWLSLFTEFVLLLR